MKNKKVKNIFKKKLETLKKDPEYKKLFELFTTFLDETLRKYNINPLDVIDIKYDEEIDNLIIEHNMREEIIKE